MRKVAVVIAVAIAVLMTMSCTTEEQVAEVESQADLSIVDDYSLVSMDTFIEGEGTSTQEFRCTDTWTFTLDKYIIINKFDRETCNFKYQSQNTYTTTEETVTIGNSTYKVVQYSGGMSLAITLSDGAVITLNFIKVQSALI
jgi:hypothetical protein